jgi:hypothetical protein
VELTAAIAFPSASMSASRVWAAALRKLRESGDRILISIADNLARLRTKLEWEPLDGVSINGLMTALAEQVRHVASEGAEGAGPAPVTGKLEDLAGLLEVEGHSLSESQKEG